MIIDPKPGPAAVRLVEPGDDHPWSFRCPGCGVWGRIDQEQYVGAVSIDHTFMDRAKTEPSGCSFHEHIDCRRLPHLGLRVP